MKKISGVKATLAMLLLAGIIAAIAGCAKGSALAGKWEEMRNGEPSGDIMELLSDGTADFDGIEGEWKTEKDQIMFSAWGITVTYTYKISGSTLTLIDDDDGKEEIYKKVKK